jgi:hypothetical protein
MCSVRHRPRPFYRLRQFLTSLRPHVGPQERFEACAHLGPAQVALFESMALRDQRHCLDVFQALRRQGCVDPELLAAALLHDVGKGDVRLWHRVIYVLLEGASPRLLDRWVMHETVTWRRALGRLRRHSSDGAATAAAAGTPLPVVRLISGDPEDPRSAILQAADDSC